MFVILQNIASKFRNGKWIGCVFFVIIEVRSGINFESARVFLFNERKKAIGGLLRLSCLRLFGGIDKSSAKGLKMLLLGLKL